MYLSAEGKAASVLIVGRLMVHQEIRGGRIVRAEHVELLEALGLYHLEQRGAGKMKIAAPL